ncbi:hypothetical protein NJBCHELONAE_12340 [Mycobacteroides chelonae]|nr:hypothetical protein NJBCHELONAE_12340 [Mycobacteroides chelonae]
MPDKSSNVTTAFGVKSLARNPTLATAPRITGEFIAGEYCHPRGVGTANIGSSGALASNVTRGMSLVAHPSTAATDGDVDDDVTDAADVLDASLGDCCEEHPAATATITPNTATAVRLGSLTASIPFSILISYRPFTLLISINSLNGQPKGSKYLRESIITQRGEP